MLKNLAKKVYRRIFPRILPEIILKQMNKRETLLVNKLRNEFLTTPYYSMENLVKSGEEWTKNMNRLKDLVINSDPREFLKWDVIKYTMFVGDAKYINEEYTFLKNRQNYSNRWLNGLKENDLGCPNRYYHLAKSSGNLVHHSFHLAQFEEKTKSNINNYDFVFEFGGGYGSMCRLFHNLNYDKKYLIYDLAPFSALQKYYLQSIGLNVIEKETFVNSDSGILCISEIEELEYVLKNSNLSNSLFLATWSISETPLEVRDNILPLTNEITSYLIAYQDDFYEVNNINYFKNFSIEKKNHNWNNFAIEHLPNNNYLFGTAKQS